MAKINDPDKVEYLVLQGGGGKGVAYLGAIRALEEKGVLPIKQTNERNAPRLKGVAGTSAGAITALLIALGFTADEIDKKFLSKPELFTSFFDGPDNGSYRTVSSFNVPGRSDRSVHINLNETVEAFIKKSGDMDAQNPIVRTLAISLLGFLQSSAQYTGLLKQPAHEVLFMLIKGSDTSHRTDALKGKLIGAGSKNLGLEFLFYQIIQAILPNSEPEDRNDIVRKLKDDPYGYIFNLLFDRGLFPGYAVRDFFGGIIGERFKNFFSEDIDGSTISFETFYEHTKCNLLFTGVNVSKNRPQYFSKDHTPDFPVAEAAAISMNIPIVFKPVYVEAENLEGFWVDGGTVFNLPLHAFDYIEKKELLDSDGKTYYDYLHPSTLALSLVPYLPGEEPVEKSWTDELPIVDFTKGVVDVLWEPNERQIQQDAEREQIIQIPYGKLSTLNFAPNEELKKDPINRAYEQVIGYFR